MLLMDHGVELEANAAFWGRENGYPGWRLGGPEGICGALVEQDSCKETLEVPEAVGWEIFVWLAIPVSSQAPMGHGPTALAGVSATLDPNLPGFPGHK